MNAKDIMIGNLVLYNGNPMEVTLVNNDGGVVAKSVSNKLPPVLTSADEFDPIPLTEATLVKNGFDKKSKAYFRFENVSVFECDSEWHISISKSDDCNIYIDGYIKYVHQLQNLLRMCNISKIIEL